MCSIFFRQNSTRSQSVPPIQWFHLVAVRLLLLPPCHATYCPSVQFRLTVWDFLFYSETLFPHVAVSCSSLVRFVFPALIVFSCSPSPCVYIVDVSLCPGPVFHVIATARQHRHIQVTEILFLNRSSFWIFWLLFCEILFLWFSVDDFLMMFFLSGVTFVCTYNS